MVRRTRSHVIIIGAGLMGLSTAYALSERGQSVTVIDARPGPGEGASFANSGMIHPGQAMPWHRPSVNALAENEIRTAAIAGYHLGEYSVQLLRSMDAAQLQTRGSLAVATIGKAGQAFSMAEVLAGEGLSVQALSRAQIQQLEPGLTLSNDMTALYYPGDMWGSALGYAKAITDNLRGVGATFIFNQSADEIITNQGRAAGIRLSGGQELRGDAIVLAAGIHSPDWADLPMIEARGYALTLPKACAELIARPVMDIAAHGALTPFTDALRVSGTVDDSAGTDARKAALWPLWDILERYLPDAAQSIDRKAHAAWTGFRPVSKDGRPFIGQSAVNGLFVNTGHGHMGWTQSAGSGALLADIICGHAPDIDPRPFDPCR